MNELDTAYTGLVPEESEYTGDVEPVMDEEVSEREAQSELERLMEMDNIAEYLKDELLAEIGGRVYKDFEVDEKSRTVWEEQNREALKLASLIADEKTNPWPRCSNIIFPLIIQSAIQFAARAYSTMIQGKDVVKGKVIGEDEGGEKAKRGERIGEHMSCQLLETMDDWEEDMDRMLTVLPIVGTTFKKTWYDPTTGKNVSQFVSAEDVVVNNNSPRVLRMTHVYELYPNEIVERERAETFLETEYTGRDSAADDTQAEEDAPRTFLEQHRWWDLDEDGYQEPYIVTVHKDSQKVVRIVARWDPNGIVINEKKEIVKIIPVKYFTKYGFLPPIDGSYYNMGFGLLLQHPNKAINSIINQLVDAGTLANMGGGFISADAKTPSGSIRLRLGEYIKVKASSLRDSIWERPIHEPSPALFELLKLLIDFSKELSSSTDLMAGQQPGAGVPATTVLAMLKEGMTIFTSIYQRVHRSFGEELKKLYRLNSMYLSDEEYYNIHDTPQAIARQDYNLEDCDVVPVSDPNDISDSQRMMKAQALMQMQGQGFNDHVIKKRWLEAMQISDADELLPEEGEGTASAEEQMMAKKMELEEKKLGIEESKLGLEERKLDLEEQKLVIEADKADAEIQKKRTESAKNLAEIDRGDKEGKEEKKTQKK